MIVSHWALLVGPIFLISYYLIPYLWTYRSLRSIPGPITAKLTNFWLLYACRAGKRYHYVDEAHKRYGPIVRIQPNHVSIADEEVINTIYGHGNGLLKTYVLSLECPRYILTSSIVLGMMPRSLPLEASSHRETEPNTRARERWFLIVLLLRLCVISSPLSILGLRSLLRNGMILLRRKQLMMGTRMSRAAYG